MATRIHRPLKVIAFNANSIVRERYELRKQLQDLHVDVALLSEISETSWEVFISNYQFYLIDRHRGWKGYVDLQ
jgi:hypothetical protein